MRRIKKILSLIVLVLLASCFLGQLQVSAQGQGQMLTGEGKFDMTFVQEYFTKLNHIDVAAAPAPYPDTDTKANGHRSMLGTLNPEFRKRIDALVAIYQAFCGMYHENIDIGIVPISGALRTKEDQQELYKKGRHQVPGTDGTHQQDWQPAHTPNAVTTGSGPSDPSPRNNGIAHIRHRRSYLRASTKMQGANGASYLFAVGAGTEGWCHYRVWDSGAYHVKVVAGGFSCARRHQDRKSSSGQVL